MKSIEARVTRDTIETEVLIIGGGLVGATLAIALGSAGLKVCVIIVLVNEKFNFSRILVIETLNRLFFCTKKNTM